MIVEMLLLALIALAAFAYVLAPIVMPRQSAMTLDDPPSAVDTEHSAVEKQPAHDPS